MKNQKNIKKAYIEQLMADYAFSEKIATMVYERALQIEHCCDFDDILDVEANYTYKVVQQMKEECW